MEEGPETNEERDLIDQTDFYDEDSLELDDSMVVGDPNYIMPPVISVSIPSYDGEAPYSFDVIVEKVSGDYSKPYLGGFRHKLTSQTFHHSATQTVEMMGSQWSEDMYDHVRTRETQTVVEKTRCVQTGRECGTQMDRRGIFLDTTKDKPLVTRSSDYFTSDQLWQLRREKVLVIQTEWRGYLGRRRAWTMRETLAMRQQEEDIEQMERQEKQRESEEAEVKKRVDPRSREEFSQLYNELHTWRKSEIEKINETADTEEDRIEMMQELLERQTRVLQMIDQMKVQALRDSAHKRRETMLKLMAEPKVWESSDGKVTTVHTPFTTRANELLTLYTALTAPITTTEERLDVLLHIKHTVTEFKSLLTTNITDLVNREADLLNRGRSFKSMESLRTRLRNSFIQFMETPEYNPQVNEFLGLNNR